MEFLLEAKMIGVDIVCVDFCSEIPVACYFRHISFAN